MDSIEVASKVENIGFILTSWLACNLEKYLTVYRRVLAHWKNPI